MTEERLAEIKQWWFYGGRHLLVPPFWWRVVRDLLVYIDELREEA